jgi:hypothetical protein
MTVETFCSIGVALYGQNWKRQMADALGVSDKAVYRWSRSRQDIPEGVVYDLRKIIAERVNALQRLSEAI